MVKIIYHPAYLKYNFGPGHPFWPERALVFLEKIKKTDLKYELVKPPKAADEDVLLVHTKDYLQQLKRLAPERGYLTIDTPINEDRQRVLKADETKVLEKLEHGEADTEGGDDLGQHHSPDPQEDKSIE